MLTSAEWKAIASELVEVRGDNEAQLTLRRGNASLAPQSARITRASGARRYDNTAGEESRTAVIVMFGVGADAQPEDRFTYNGRAYRVVSIRPNTRASVMVDAEMVE